MIMPRTIPPIVFITFLSVSRATAIFFSAAPMVALSEHHLLSNNKNFQIKKLNFALTSVNSFATIRSL